MILKFINRGLILFTLMIVSQHIWADGFQCRSLSEAPQVQLKDVKDSSFSIMKIDTSGIDDFWFPSHMFKINDIRGANPQSRFPFLRSRMVVSKLQDLLKKGIVIFLNQRCEPYGALVVFSENEKHASFLKKLNLNDSSLPLLVLSTTTTDDQIVHELVHIDQALNNFDNLTTAKLLEIFLKNKFDWEKASEKDKAFISIALNIVREAPAYEAQISYLNNFKPNDESLKVFIEQRMPIHLEIVKLNYFLSEVDPLNKNSLCEFLKEHQNSLKQFNFINLLTKCNDN